ncbi:MAG: hypothetical protein JWN62_3011 [Acidimicrobiales bacterium]|nr:hypothetical protein [Acidimicrobiales bacterium]
MSHCDVSFQGRVTRPDFTQQLLTSSSLLRSFAGEVNGLGDREACEDAEPCVALQCLLRRPLHGVASTGGTVEADDD